MTYQISIEQLRKAVSEFRVSKRNVEDTAQVKDALNRYWMEHAPLFDVVDGQLTVNPAIRLYIAWKDSVPVFHFCYKRDMQAAEMMLRNEFTEYGDMSHRSIEDWLDILERHKVTQITTVSAVEDSMLTTTTNIMTNSIQLSDIYRKYYVSDCRKPTCDGHTRLWLEDGIGYPSYTGNYDIPNAIVPSCLAYYEQNGSLTTEFKDLNS